MGEVDFERAGYISFTYALDEPIDVDYKAASLDIHTLLVIDVLNRDSKAIPGGVSQEIDIQRGIRY